MQLYLIKLFLFHITKKNMQYKINDNHNLPIVQQQLTAKYLTDSYVPTFCSTRQDTNNL